MWPSESMYRSPSVVVTVSLLVLDQARSGGHDADASGLVAAPPFLAGHPRGVDVLGQRPQGADRRLVLLHVDERVPVEEPAGVLPRHLLDLVVRDIGGA